MNKLFVLLAFLSLQSFAQVENSTITEIRLPTYNIEHGYYKVESNKEYRKLQNTLIKTPGNDKKYTYPEIDFNHFILMGVRILNGGCEKIEVRQSLNKNDQNRIITFNLDLVQTGNCLDAKVFNYWVLIEKTHRYKYLYKHNLIQQN